MTLTVTLYRPVGREELDLIEEARMRAFPPRLPSQPIFYPVANEEYAVEIARDWNTKHGAKQGYVTRFAVSGAHLEKYERRIVGAERHAEYWIPAEDLEEFNANIIGAIEVIACFESDERARSQIENREA